MTIRFLAIIAAVVAFVGAAAWIYHQGGKAEAVKTERQNNAAANTADQARSNFDRCIDSGGVYNFATGKCGRPSTRGRN